MEIIVGKTAGFCFGVANAVNKTNKLLKDEKNICCLGELVHNKQVTDELKNKGLIEIKNINEAKENVIIRSHGVEKSVYNKAKKLGLKVFDLTCPKVLKIHNIAVEYANKGYYILLIGKKEHPEVIGTISYCQNNADILEDETQIQEKLNTFYRTGIKNLLIIEQTTNNIEKFNKIISQIEQNVKQHNNDINIEIKKTICDATRLRQEETIKISKQVDYMIIIGGKNSSNTNKLFEIAKKNCKNSSLIETYKDLNIDKIKNYKKIGIMAGASTPKKSIDEVVEKINGAVLK